MKNREILISLIRQHGKEKGTAIEVGVDEGVSSELLLRTFPELQLIMVDHWKAHKSWPRRNPYYKSQKEMDRRMRLALSRTDFAADRRTILQGESTKMARETPDALADFIFIDATHTPRALKWDLISWGPKLAPGGLLLCDDIGGMIDRHMYKGAMSRVAIQFARRHKYPRHYVRTEHMWYCIRECTDGNQIKN